MSENVSHEASREHKRSKPVPGGKKTCAHCDDPRGPGTSYCRFHKQIYDRDWRLKRAEQFRSLKAIAEGMKE